MSADLLLKALDQLPAWQSDLARRLTLKRQLDEQDIAEIEANVLANGGRRITREDLPEDARASGSPRLLGIREVQSVGRLRPGAAITFDRAGLTVVYGDNGAGKTSFVRTLKESCRAVDGGDPILCDVFADASRESRYGLDVEVDGAVLPIERRGGMPSDPRLGSVSIFDASCAGLYVSKALGLAYVPQPLQLLERVASELQTLRERWKAAAVELEGQRPRFEELPLGTRARTLMDSALPAISDIESLAVLSEGESARLVELGRHLSDASAVAHDRQALLARKARFEKLRARAERLGDASSDQAIAEWRRLEAESDRLDAELAAFGQTLERMLPGVASASWREMMSAAGVYRAEHLTEAHDDHCALCQQDLDDAARARMEDLAAIAGSELEQARASAASLARGAQEGLEQTRRAASELAQIVGDAPEDRLIRELVQSAAARLAHVLSGADSKLRSAPATADQLDQIASSIESRLAELGRFDDPSVLSRLSHEAYELKARRMLGDRVADARRCAQVATDAARLRSLLEGSKTNRLSTVTKKMTNDLLAGRLGQKLKSALRDLGIRHLKVELKTSAAKGEARFQLVLQTKSKAKLDAVFSGGEQTALALACFLAEVAASEHDGTIVLDDPVSSLDADRRRNVARRLVEESRRRQVIVFTHDPGFFILLEREAERAGALPRAVRTITNVNGTAGHVTSEPPRVVANTKQLSKELEHQLEQLREEGLDASQYESRVLAFGTRLRQAWERLAVEAFSRVVEPGSFEVRTRNLDQVVIDDQLVDMVNRGMGATSFVLHDQGTTMPKHLPTVNELEDELACFEKARLHVRALRRSRSVSSAAE